MDVDVESDRLVYFSLFWTIEKWILQPQTTTKDFGDVHPVDMVFRDFCQNETCFWLQECCLNMWYLLQLFSSVCMFFPHVPFACYLCPVAVVKKYIVYFSMWYIFCIYIYRYIYTGIRNMYVCMCQHMFKLSSLFIAFVCINIQSLQVLPPARSIHQSKPRQSQITFFFRLALGTIQRLHLVGRPNLDIDNFNDPYLLSLIPFVYK